MYEFKFNERLQVRIPTEHLLKGDTAPPQRRYSHSMVAYAGQLYVFGGAADSILDNEVHCMLRPPYAASNTYQLVKEFVEEVVLVSDEEIKET